MKYLIALICGALICCSESPRIGLQAVDGSIPIRRLIIAPRDINLAETLKNHGYKIRILKVDTLEGSYEVVYQCMK